MHVTQHAAAVEDVARGPATVAVFAPYLEIGIEHHGVRNPETLDRSSGDVGIPPERIAGRMHADDAKPRRPIALVPSQHVRMRPHGIDPRKVEELDKDRTANLLSHPQESDVEPREPLRELRGIGVVVGRKPQRMASSSFGDTHSSIAQAASSIGTAIATVTNVAAIR